MNTQLNSNTTNPTIQFCHHLASVVRDLRDRLVEKYAQTFPGREHLVRKAVDEAELMAWQTSFPHLLFPDLVEVRVTALARSRTYDFADAA